MQAVHHPAALWREAGIFEIAIVPVHYLNEKYKKFHHFILSIFRHLVNYSEKVLECSLSILPRSGFVAALKSLLADDHDVVRRKALEVGGCDDLDSFSF